MAAEDTHEVDIAHQAMEDLAECLAIHGRVMAAVPPDRRLATVEVVTRLAVDTTVVVAAVVTPAAEVEVTQAVAVEVTQAAVDIAATTNCDRQS